MAASRRLSICALAFVALIAALPAAAEPLDPSAFSVGQCGGVMTGYDSNQYQCEADRKPAPLLTGFNTPASECCGVWSADGSRFIFQSTRGGNSDLWELRGESTSSPIRLTDGPLQFQSPVAARSGNRLFFLGVDGRSELQRLTPSGLVPEKGFHDAIDAARTAGVKLRAAGKVFPYEAHQRYFDEEVVPRLDDERVFVGPVEGAAKRRLLSGGRTTSQI